MQPPSVNCIYDNGTVLYADNAESCPLTNGDAALVDVTTLETSINVTTDPPAPSSAVWWIAAAALVLLFLKKPR